MEHYYTSRENISNNSLTITGDEAKHLAKVLRKKSGEEIYVTDGEGNLYKCLIEKISKENIDCSIIEKSFGANEPEIKVTLYQSLLKSPDRFEFAIEKSVELGVNSVQPIITEHVVNKKRDKTARWQQIALAAMKQSQRCYLPLVSSPLSFTKAVESCDSEIKLIADEHPPNPLQRGNERVDSRSQISELRLQNIKTCSIFIGPEGGFTKEEVEFALQNGFKILSLGKRKYRSETAALAALTLILNI
jgi:16S rRNA (uracil1498-N3)-methyltransferase